MGRKCEAYSLLKQEVKFRLLVPMVPAARTVDIWCWRCREVVPHEVHSAEQYVCKGCGSSSRVAA